MRVTETGIKNKCVHCGRKFGLQYHSFHFSAGQASIGPVCVYCFTRPEKSDPDRKKTYIGWIVKENQERTRPFLFRRSSEREAVEAVYAAAGLPGTQTIYMVCADDVRTWEAFGEVVKVNARLVHPKEGA